MVDPEDLRVAYLLGKNSCNEISAELLKKTGWPNEKIVKVINMLIENRLCVTRKKKGSDSVQIFVRSEEAARNVRTLSQNDYSVYCAIEASDNVGVWTFDLCKMTGLQSHIIQRAVRTLCDVKQLIKPLRSIHQKNRKMYILTNLEPSKDVVGGTFYKNAELDEDFVESLRNQIIHLLKNSSKASFFDICNYLQTSSKEKNLTNDDIELILFTLFLEQQIDMTKSITGDAFYLWRRWTDENIFLDFPCGTCPVSSECIRIDGLTHVNPSNCLYFDLWLGYDKKLHNITLE